MKRLYRRVTTKCNQPYSSTCGYVKSRVAITLVRATHRCICGYQVPVFKDSVQRTQWEDGAGFHLYRQAQKERKKILITSVIYFMLRSQNCGFSRLSSENKKWDASHHTHVLTRLKLSKHTQCLQQEMQSSLDFYLSLKFIKVHF